MKTCRELDCACFQCPDIVECHHFNYLSPCDGRIKNPDCQGYPRCEMGPRKCRVCGCTNDKACITPEGPCSWVEWDLCSACADKEAKTK
jgi:hypothetical protein